MKINRMLACGVYLVALSFVYADELKIPFNGSLETSQGGKPLFSRDISYTDGRIKDSKALLVNDKMRLVYPQPEIFNPLSEGTVSLWVKTEWNNKTLEDPSSSGMHYLFNLTDSKDASQLRGWFYFHRPTRGLTLFFAIVDQWGIAHNVTAGIPQWEKGYWNRLIFTWKNGTGLKIYLDDGVDEKPILISGKMSLGVDGLWKDPDGKERSWKDVAKENQITEETWKISNASDGKLNFFHSGYLDGAIQDVTISSKFFTAQ